MKGTANMTGVSEGGFPVLPINEYLVEIADKQDKTTRDNKDPIVSVKLVVVNGEFAGRWIWDNVVIPNPDSPAIKILGRSKHFLHCIGEPYENEIEWDSDRWIGRRCRIIVSHEPENKWHKGIKPIVEEYLERSKDDEDNPFK